MPKSLSLERAVCVIAPQRPHNDLPTITARSYHWSGSLVSGNAVKFFTDLVYKPGAGANVFPQPFQQQINCISDISMNPSPIESAVTVQASGAGQFDISAQIMNGGRLSQSSYLRRDTPSDESGPEAEVRGEASRSRRHRVRCCPVSGCWTEMTEPAVDPELLMPAPKMSEDTQAAGVPRVLEGFPVPGGGCHLSRAALSWFRKIKLPIYLHFKLVVWDPRAVIGLKMCSYLSEVNSWQLLGHPRSDLCSCCDSVCRLFSRRRREAEKGVTGIIHTMVLGPFKLHGPAVNGSLNVSNEHKALETVSAFPIPPAAGALFLELAVLLLVSVGVAVYGRISRREYGELEKRSLITNEN
ncbi:unnamed protein product [Ranitomeya imitator]|uniref:Uncharacterized protein n=1 Tax=Ranitomeya imitator TaxID=111125 RepID=A0ABN9M8B4_9NEOB|nr:unnamed protein product [Ranitomeya imitator]